MFRPFDSTMPDYEANWILSDPVIPFGIVAVSVDTGNMKTGDGVKKWSALSYTSGSIGNKYTDSSRSPVDDETVYFSDSLDEWTYRLQGVIDTATNWESNTTIYPKFALLIEVNDSTNAPTGRFKVGDGSTAYQSLPWSGSDIDLTTFPTGYGIEFNGTYFEAKQFLEVNELPVSLTPTGTMFACDTGEWATPGTDYMSSIPVATNNNLVAFDGTDGKTVKDSGVDYTTIITGDGTPNESFQIHAGVKLFDVNGELHVKSALDAYSNIRVESIYGEFGTFDAINIGGFSTEPDSVTLTSDGTYMYVDGGKLIDVNHDGHGSSFDADTLDTYHASYFATVGHEQLATTINLSNISGSTYNTVQQWADIIQSSGRISGGVITAHSPADGTIDISALTGFIKLTDDSISTVEYFNQPGTTGIALTDNSINYIYVDCNDESPEILVTTDRSTIRYTDQFTLGRAFRNGTSVEVLTSGVNLYNRTRLIHEKWIDTFGGVSYASGLTVSCTGLKPAFTAGVLYAGSNKITIAAKDCNTSGTFDAYYTTDNGSTWTIQTAQTTLSNTQYNDVATGFATLSNNQYGIHWLYVCPNGSMYVLYGKGSYTLAQAQAVSSPVSPVPNYLAQWAKLAAKIIILKSASSVYSITLAWSTQFPVQNPGEHNSLAALQGGTTDQYYHLTSTQHTTLTGNTYCRWRGSSATDPTDPIGGDIYYKTGDSKTYIYNGTTWDILN